MDAVKVDVYVGVHKGLRSLIGRFSFEAGATDWTDPTAVARLQTQWQTVKKLLHSHHDDEMMLWIDCMFPAMNLSERAGLLAAMRVCAPPEAFEVMADRAREARGQSDGSRLEAMLVR